MANVEDIDDLEGIICARFPSMKICGCTVPCRKSLKLGRRKKGEKKIIYYLKLILFNFNFYFF